MKSLPRINSNNIVIIATSLLLVALFAAGSIKFPGFLSWQVFLNLFIDNAFLIIVATGMAFVIITGGIDLSVASVVAFISMTAGALLREGVNAYVVMLICLIVGTLFGAGQGYLITRFKLHPWIVTLAGMFLARGASYLISVESIVIDNPTFVKLSQLKIEFGGGNFISISVIIALLVVAVAIYVAKYTAFGRNIYAIGGNEKSAELMGLPVARTTLLVYSLSGFCSALGGLVFTFYMLSGYALHLMGMEMDAIASCVVGGILLTGGFGYLIGPMLGVLCGGLIQTLIMFQGTLSSWWTKIAIGFLLFLFIVIQRIIIIQKSKRPASPATNVRKTQIKTLNSKYNQI